MLGLLIFMGDRNHNTAIEGRAPLQATLHSRLRGEHAPTNQERPRAILANPDGATFTVRFWDYSRKPSNRIPRKPLKTLDRKISTREKFRFSVFHFLSLLSGGRTSISPAQAATARGLFSARVLRKESRNSSSINKTAETSRHTFSILDGKKEAT